jgi:hypothetical protein
VAARAAATALLAVALVATACGEPEDPAPAIESLPSPAGAGSGEPYLVADTAGRVYMTWLERSGDSAHALRFSVLDGERWSDPRTITTQGRMLANWADFPTLLVAPSGRLAVHWMQRTTGDGHGYDLYIAQSADGGASWTAPVVPHRDGLSAEHGFAALYAAGADAVGAAWLDGRKYAARPPGGAGSPSGARGEMMLAHTTVAADGGLGPEEMLDPRICDCCQTSLALASGGPVLVYRDRTLEEIRDISIVRNVRGSWTAPSAVHADGWRVDYCPVNGPAVAARGDGVAVAWFTAARDTSKVLVAFSADGGATFGAPVRVDDGDPVGRVDVEMDGEAAFVTWIERGEAGSAAVRLRRVTWDGVAGEATTVGGIDPGRPSGFPRIARRTGELIIAWTVTGPEPTVHVGRIRFGEPN